jgi:hypothetical protein
MIAVVLLDSAPVGSLTNPNASAIPVAIRKWLTDMLAAGRRVILPEITDYEVRRELIRASRASSLAFLDGLAKQAEYLPLTTFMMRLAADLWAQARNVGLPTAASQALDGDAIPAAQALSLGVPVVVATGNPGHLTRFVPTADWQTITP